VSGWLDFLIVLIINLAALKCPLRHLPPMHRALQFGLIVSAARTGDALAVVVNAGDQRRLWATGQAFGSAQYAVTA